jgi:adenosyl cobinamide kinase/adenosyl cobinamide phosphate guanylyltransferase
MFDFQIKEDAELTARIVRHTKERERPWIAA